MRVLEAFSASDIFAHCLEMIKDDRRQIDDSDVVYYFRGERRNYEDPYSAQPAHKAPEPGVFRGGSLKYESDIFNEALRTFPEEFKDDRTTFEILTRMQHYGYKTRLLDITPRIATAIAVMRQPDSTGKKWDDSPGFIHVYRVKSNRIKYSTGDTVTALANLARIKSDRVRIDNLRYLVDECKNDRAGYFYAEGSEETERLKKDIQKVWCVRPVMNNRRINVQIGEFFIFGCGDRKSPIEATFSECDYFREESPTEGMARIGAVVISPEAKKDVDANAQYLDSSLERIYPDFHYHSQQTNERFKNG